MKRTFTLIAACAFVASVSAQTVVESNSFENIYIGINGGASAKMTPPTGGWLNKVNANAGVRIGRYFTPVFGLAVESNAYFSTKPYESSKTVVRAINTSLLGTVNMSNWIAGYKGEPRTFEVSALYGFGWGHFFANSSEILGKRDCLTSKAAVDFAFNLGAKKALQLYIEPAVVWGLNNSAATVASTDANGQSQTKPAVALGSSQIAYDINRAYAQLNVGLIYKLRNSKGTHNFVLADMRDQTEIDALNAQINDLRSQLAKKPAQVEVVKEVVKEVPAEGNNVLFVTFAQGNCRLTNEAKATLDAIPQGAHVSVVGTASPEGPKAVNERISQGRADNVADYLRSRGVIVDDATGKGVQGSTSNRLAIIYVK